MPIKEISSPWGSVALNIDDPNYYKHMLGHLIQQLKYFRDVQGNKTKQLARDIEGYEILTTFKNEQIEIFFNEKRKAKAKGYYEDNVALIEYLKENNILN